MVLTLGFLVTTYFYAWHIRPNVGLYEEPPWVAEIPQFQKQMREKIERNCWFAPTPPAASDT